MNTHREIITPHMRLLMQVREDVNVIRPKALNLTTERLANTITNTPTVSKKENVQRRGISICLTAWRMQDYIEECLDSIEAQTYFKECNDYEILLGIDGCEMTLEKVESIQRRYHNLRVFMMEENVGTYVTTNTMMSLAKYDWLLRFDTDDVMLPNMVEKILDHVSQHPEIDILRPFAVNFGTRNNLLGDRHGCVLMKRSIFTKFGGYKPWKCAADGELQYRLKKFVVIQKYTKVVFRRRLHSTNLTVAKETNLVSPMRKEYQRMIKSRVYTKESDAVIGCEIGKYVEITFPERYQVIVSLTSYPARFKYIPMVVDEIRKGSMVPYKICLCIYKNDMEQLTDEIKRLAELDIIEIIVAEEDIKPHTKYYYTMKKYKNNPIITIDDDVLYDKDTVKSLYDNYVKHQNVVSARRVHKIAYKNGVADDYRNWAMTYTQCLVPRKDLFATGVGAVLYPPDILRVDDIKMDDIYACLYADDILLKWVEDNHGVLTMWVPNSKPHGNSIHEASNASNALYKTNLNKNRNTEYLKKFILYQ